jgi:hypothetical protein
MAQLVFKVHAVRRMSQRHVSVDDVIRALASGRQIAEVPSHGPRPVRVILGRSGSRPLHVVVCGHNDDDYMVVFTVYEPDPDRWDAALRRRRR